MRELIVVFLLASAAPGAIAAAGQFVVGSVVGAAQTEVGVLGRGTPIDRPVGTAVAETKSTDTQEGLMPDAALLAQQGAIGILAVVLFFYRRDFLKKNERVQEELEEKLRERTEEKEQLADLIDKSNTCITQSAVAMARQTDATHRLARTVENIERRAAGLPPSANTPGGSV
jgi:hypothetical protein